VGIPSRLLILCISAQIILYTNVGGECKLSPILELAATLGNNRLVEKKYSYKNPLIKW